ncbi:LOW QUALITY PROTEIN: uncharacterized protein LOC114354594 [Ostrinia furnacalis]|uniref:LOW QUALITY PROTEIN: uncharacterized protein LOC114354594 n=1 Tax=Ostrinia furnacalis TaxID=93504 RepID=UPI00103FA07E|nr:LOW QUALITY PROTEIN: uncharacterized protein LOC114354594 [Ostrinia furnacalis]
MSVCDSGDAKLDAAVNTWLKHDKNPETRKEVLDDISAARWDKLKKTMLRRQKFGTAGLRGRMGAGYQCMNDVVILQTAQGLCSYIQKVCNQSQLKNGVVVGYDGRYNSKRFADLTTKVFVSASIPVHLFTDVCPTPLVSFATILYGAAAGVMVTASHNPKEDNGYKVYWGNGCQIIAPHDQLVLEEIEQCLDIPEEHWNIDEIRSHPLVTDCLEEATTKYMEYIRSSLHPDILETNKKAAIDTVYSAMHGVGYKYIVKAFEAANLKLPISVPEQQEPDPSFPVSHRFADLTTKVFVSASIPVHLFTDVCPTPLVSFATILYGAAAGVMVTASHNPKEDNGYKVYWGNGCQIIAPHDQLVLEEIEQCLDIPEEHWNIDEIRSHPLVTDCLEEATTKYMEYIRSSLHPDILETNKKAAIDTVYSAMHGVGYKYIVKAFEAANLKLPISVPEQQEPEPSFPTVVFPNPEEPACLELSTGLAERSAARLLLVNDPDADRLAVAERDHRSRELLSYVPQQEPEPSFPTVVFPNPEEPACLELSTGLAERSAARLLLVNDPDADRLAVAERDHSVPQQEPEPSFPTVVFPNPEEPACLELSTGLAERSAARLLLVNDPDADRLAVAERDHSVPQQEPEPSFPTVVFPNPEEPACLELSTGLAERSAARLLLVNDPDADRLAVAERDHSVPQQEPEPSFPTVVFPNPEEPACLELSTGLAERSAARLLLVNDPDADRLAPPIGIFHIAFWLPISVPQQEPEPSFPTVVFPNPEEPACLELSTGLAERSAARLLLVNDPDADRLAVAERDHSTKSWKVFTGNEMGALLGWWLLEQNSKRNDASEVYVIASVVSSKMLRALVQGKGEFVETLTGFKWMGNTTLLLAQQGKLPLFAFEEAIGYMCNHRVPDKDGVSAAVQCQGPSFPTVVFPNPEEPACLELSTGLAERSAARLLLVNDPDADRLAVAERDHRSRELLS